MKSKNKKLTKAEGDKPLTPADCCVALVEKWRSIVNGLKKAAKNNPELIKDESLHCGQLSSLYFCINDLKSVIKQKVT